MMDTLRPESILIDEIQDLSVSEVLALMLLTRLSAPQANRAIFVGDQFQLERKQVQVGNMAERPGAPCT